MMLCFEPNIVAIIVVIAVAILVTKERYRDLFVSGGGLDRPPNIPVGGMQYRYHGIQKPIK